jgi:uncharacterized damage-inducible protein DinB
LDERFALEDFTVPPSWRGIGHEQSEKRSNEMAFEKYQLETLRNLPKVIIDYVSKIPEDRIEVKRNAETWTIKEHIFHLVEVQEVHLNRIKTILSEQNPVIEPYFPDAQPKKISKRMTLKSAFTKYKRFRKEQYQLFKTASEQDVSKPARHKEFSQYNLPILLHHMIFHEYWHMHRIEEIWLTNEEYFK